MLPSQGIHHDAEGGGRVPPAGIIEEVAFPGGAPVFQNTHKRSRREMRCSLIFEHVGRAEAIDSCLHEQLGGIGEKPGFDGER